MSHDGGTRLGALKARHGQKSIGAFQAHYGPNFAKGCGDEETSKGRTAQAGRAYPDKTSGWTRERRTGDNPERPLRFRRAALKSPPPTG